METPNGAALRQMLQDRRVQIAVAVLVLLILAAVSFLVFSGGDTTAEAPADVPPGSGSPGGYPGAPLDPVDPDSPGAPGGFAPAAPSPAGANAKNLPTSFDGAPGSPAAAAGAPGGGATPDPFGGPPVDDPMGAPPGLGGPPGGGAGGPAVPKPPPIQPGRKPVARTDPFFLLRQPASLTPPRPPAYLFTVPMRLASFRVPQVPRLQERDVEVVRPPLPYVPRRVAGILTNGTVSAILETGNPGPDAQVDLVNPGSRVDSGIPGVPQMIVESITSTQVTLRAQDGRRVTVRLSALPPGALQQFQGGAEGIDGPPGGPGGFPGGPPRGFPGGPPGGLEAP